MLINDVLEPWLSKPTWFSHNPSDNRRFYAAMSQLRRFPVVPSVDELESIIYQRVIQLPSVKGTPYDLHTTARAFSFKIRARLHVNRYFY